MFFGTLFLLYIPVEVVSTQIYIGLIGKVFPPKTVEAYIEARANAEQILVDSFKEE